MGDSSSTPEELLRLAAEGVPWAQAQLLECYRERLRRMVTLRLDRRMATRVDPSDVVQDTLHNAHQRLSEYFGNRSASFYPWLRGIAWDRIVDLYRVHVRADKRTVLKEQPCVWPNDEAVTELAQSFAGNSADNPRRQAMLAEVQQRVRAALLEMTPLDREVLTLRYLEHLSVQEIAEVQLVTPSVVTSRHLRALKRLRERLGPSFEF